MLGDFLMSLSAYTPNPSSGQGQNQGHEYRNQEATIYVGNLDSLVTTELLWELFIQVGRVVNVFIPRDRISQTQQGYAFVEFATEADADYACLIMNMVRLYNNPMRINKAAADKRPELGAVLFIGNLDPGVDEKMLFDTFGSFGVVLFVKIVANQQPIAGGNPSTQTSKRHGFITFDSFEASDAAIAAMNGQFLMNMPIKVGYAMKKDGSGEPHGTPSERLLASQNRRKTAITPNRLFIQGPNDIPAAI
jgi:splicing factor 3B subunit 4